MAKQSKRDPRIKWDEAKELLLMDIIEHGENGQLKKVIKERATNIKLVQGCMEHCDGLV